MSPFHANDGENFDLAGSHSLKGCDQNRTQLEKGHRQGYRNKGRRRV